MTRSRPTAILLAALAGIFLCSCAIGIKKWPSAQIKEYQFKWRGVIASRQDKCLMLDGVLSGNYGNLKSVLVQLEALGDNEPGYGCVNCPFNVRQAELVEVGDPRMTRSAGQISIVLCDLEADRTYRYRLVANNVLDNLAPVATDVALVRPQP